jgi:hypothetical protein
VICELPAIGLWSYNPGVHNLWNKKIHLLCLIFTRLTWLMMGGPSCMGYLKAWVKSWTIAGSSLRMVTMFVDFMGPCFADCFFLKRKPRGSTLTPCAESFCVCSLVQATEKPQALNTSFCNSDFYVIFVIFIEKKVALIMNHTLLSWTSTFFAEG